VPFLFSLRHESLSRLDKRAWQCNDAEVLAQYFLSSLPALSSLLPPRRCGQKLQNFEVRFMRSDCNKRM
jgi:hypothetical protein